MITDSRVLFPIAVLFLHCITRSTNHKTALSFLSSLWRHKEKSREFSRFFLCVNYCHLSLLVNHDFFSFHSPDATPTSTPGEFFVKSLQRQRWFLKEVSLFHFVNTFSRVAFSESGKSRKLSINYAAYFIQYILTFLFITVAEFNKSLFHVR